MEFDGIFYAYYAPKSSSQAKYTSQRLAAFAEQRAQLNRQAKTGQGIDAELLERTDSCQTARLGSAAVLGRPENQRRGSGRNGGSMDTARLGTSSSSGSSSTATSEHAHHALLSSPFELRHGRRYLREVPYPLPCDLPEIQRQNLRTLLGCKIFGRPVCAPKVAKDLPKKVLELGCGSGYWSTMCHEYLCSLGQKDTSFTGLDLAPLAPDHSKQGLNWNFVQHDLRRHTLPFEDGEFDLVMLKDLSLVLQLGHPFEKFLDESMRVLGEGGSLEIWESDHVMRALLPHPPPPPSKQKADHEFAKQTGTFLISPGTPFAPVQNKYLSQANNWIQEALDRRKLPPLPCSRIAQVLYQEPELLGDVGIRRVAVPLGELRWERDATNVRNDSPKTPQKGKAKASGDVASLTEEQYAIRQTALMTVLQKIESLEPLLKEVSGKNTEEWSHWWASMMSNLLDPSRGALSGECLEVGAWWATKLAGDN